MDNKTRTEFINKFEKVLIDRGEQLIPKENAKACAEALMDWCIKNQRMCSEQELLEIVRPFKKGGQI